MIVYTSVIGNTDKLHDPVNPGNAKYVCFTDDPAIRSHIWTIVRVPRTDSPMRECRLLKQRPYEVFGDHAVSIWIDAQFQLAIDPNELALLYPQELVGFKHPKRRRISQEAQAIVRGNKAPRDQVMAQLASYQADGWDTARNPQKFITNGGLLIRRDTSRMRKFGEMWNHEVQSRCLRDQMSIDYCAAKCGVEQGHFNTNMFRSPYVVFHPWHEKPASVA